MLTHRKAEYNKSTKTISMLEYNDPRDFDKHPSPRIMNTHLPFHHLPDDVRDKRLKVVFVQRNPKDVLVSHYHHAKRNPQPYPGNFNEFFLDFFSIAGK